MRILIIGQGAREHALGWKLKTENSHHELAFAPGNAGTELLGKNLSFVDQDKTPYAQLAQQFKPNLVVVGPELALAQGLADDLEAKGFRVFGPKREGAMLEASKVFAKSFMAKHQIPTASYHPFEAAPEAMQYIEKAVLPIVIKADGLSQGKGSVIASTKQEARLALANFMEKEILGAAGKRVVVEEFLKGEELSFLCFFDGEHFVYLPPSLDYKRLSADPASPMTGGMGCVAPIDLKQTLWETIVKDILKPFRQAIHKENISYRGIIYFGLMLTAKGPKVLEFNTRFGDPETQALVGLTDISFAEMMQATSEGLLSYLDSNLFLNTLAAKSKYSACVVLASEGYPNKPVVGRKILLPPTALPSSAMLFHAGTKKEGGDLVTTGGRVFSVVGIGNNPDQARDKAYQALKLIHFEGMRHREDIGYI